MEMRSMIHRRGGPAEVPPAAGAQFDSWLAGAKQMQGGIDVQEQLPCHVQTPAFVAAWMQRHGAPGAVVVVRHAKLGLYEYLLDEVRRIDVRLKRIYLADHGVFRLDGNDLARPRGRFSLLAPTGAVLDAALAGRTWMNGRPAVRRPHSTRELGLADAARRARDVHDLSGIAEA